MDEMIIKSGLLKGIIGAIVKKILKKKLDISPELSIYKLEIKAKEDGSYDVHLCLDGNISLSDIISLSKRYL